MIILQVREAKTLREKSQGLIGQSSIKPLLLQTRWGIHTFGMKVSIDVIILDNNNKVVQFVENLKPNKLYLWNPSFKNVLELPEGTIKRNSITKGQIIKIHRI